MKLVIDANFLVSAYATAGTIQRYWRALDARDCRRIISPEIFAEVERSLRQSEFGLSNSDIRLILKDILDHCELVRAGSRYAGLIPDESDRHLVALAIETEADQILTGDGALLAAKTIEGIAIVSPRNFFGSESNCVAPSVQVID